MAAVARGAIRRLEHMRDSQPFFMWVDLFDPHEPFDPPRHYFDRYFPDYDGVIYTYPLYGRCDGYSPEELRAIRAAYLAEATMVDCWAGAILSAVFDSGLNETTTVIFTSDHGIAYGDHGYTGKNFFPLYTNIARLPLLVSTPETRATRRTAVAEQIVQPVDLMPTILDLMERILRRRSRPSLWGICGCPRRNGRCSIPPRDLASVTRRCCSMFATTRARPAMCWKRICLWPRSCSRVMSSSTFTTAGGAAMFRCRTFIP